MSRREKGKVNNKGFSLVELLIAVSILAVISVTIVTFMGTSSKTYSKSSTEATLQSEAQLVANSISELIIDCTANIDYNSAETDTFSGVTNNSPSVLQIVNDKERFLIYLEDDKLYFVESNRTDTSVSFPNYTDTPQVLAEHVTDFQVNKDRYEAEHILWFQLTYQKNNRTYNGTYQVNLRNHITLDQGTTTEEDAPNGINSITVTPSETYINIKNKKLYDDTGREISTLTFVSRISPDTYEDSYYDKSVRYISSWSLSSESAGAHFVSAVRGASGAISYQDTFSYSFEDEMEATEADITSWHGSTSPEHQANYNMRNATIYLNPENINQKSFNVIVDGKEADHPGITKEVEATNAARVLVRKVTGVSLSATSGLETETSATGVSTMKARKGGTVVLSALVEGWNLGTANSGVTWQVEYKQGDEANYKLCDSSSIASIATSGAGISMILGNDVTTRTSFRVTAISTFDNSMQDVLEFGVKSSMSNPDANKNFSRGINVDLDSYFNAYGVEGWICDEFISAYVSNVPNLDSNSSDVFIITEDGQLYIDYEAANLKYYGDRLALFYKSMQVDVVVTFRGWQPGGNNYGEYTVTCHITLPAVEMYKTTTTLSQYIHTWNQATTEERTEIAKSNPEQTESRIKQAMTALNNDSSVQNIVIAKGNTKAANFYVQGYNIVKASLIGVFVDDGSSKMGNDITAKGNESSNPYITAALTSSTGTRTKLADTGIISIKATSQKSSPEYPVDKIPLNIAIKDFYQISKAASSYTTYNVYVANVEGTTIFIPGPDSSEWNSSIRYSTSGVNVTTGPANTKVKIAQLSTGQYQLIYNNKNYIYNTTYHYWAEQ